VKMFKRRLGASHLCDSLKMTTFWRTHRSDDGASTHLRNVGLLIRDYTVLYPRR
jgi:hypothetical protein